MSERFASERVGTVAAWLAELRRDDRRRNAALLAGTFVGLALTSVHWLGLLAGGALVGLASRDLKRALVAGFLFGVVVLVAFVVATPPASVGELLALRPPIYVTIATGLLLPTFGSLARGVV